MAYPPSSVAGMSAKAPSSLPIGVRAPPTITDPIPQFYTGPVASPPERWNARSDVVRTAGSGGRPLPDYDADDDHRAGPERSAWPVWTTSGSRSPISRRPSTLHTEVLGLRVVHREDNADQGVVEVMLAASARRAPATQLQLLAPLDEPSPVHRFLDRRGPGLQQLAYRGSRCPNRIRRSPAAEVYGCSMIQPEPVPGAR